MSMNQVRSILNHISESAECALQLVDASVVDRFHVCPDLASLENPERYAFMVDRERAGFLAESYGTAEYVEALEAFIEEQRITVRVDNAEMLYAYN